MFLALARSKNGKSLAKYIAVCFLLWASLLVLARASLGEARPRSEGVRTDLCSRPLLRSTEDACVAGDPQFLFRARARRHQGVRALLRGDPFALLRPHLP